MLLHIVEEMIVLALEWLELSLDTVFEEVLKFEPYGAQKATAWTGALVFFLLLIWCAHYLRNRYQRVQRAWPQWSAARKNEFAEWWAALSWELKLANLGGGLFLLLLGVLVLFT